MMDRLVAAAFPIALTTLIVAAFAVGGARVRMLSPLAGLGLFSLAMVGGGGLALLFGLLGVVRGVGSEAAERGPAIMAGAIGLGCVAFVVVIFVGAGRAPAIHDITTDVEDPPPFVAASRNAANAGRDLTYPNGSDDTARLQRIAYPDLNPILVEATKEEAFETALLVAEALGWNVVARDPGAGTFEAEHETSVFRFVDDVVVRVRAQDEGAVVDIRSLSRVGVGDMGVNAERIRWFRDALLTGRR